MSLDFDTTNPEEAKALMLKLELRQKELDTATKAKEKLGWEPKTTFKELVEDMCIYGQ